MSQMRAGNGHLTLQLIPHALVGLRQATGLQQVDVTERSRLTGDRVSAYEDGKVLPSLPSLLAYLGAIGKNFFDLQEALDALQGSPHDQKMAKKRRKS